MKTQDRKKRKEPREKKPFTRNREQERSLKPQAQKIESVGDKLDRLIKEKNNQIETLAQENIVCPHCGWEHDPEDLNISKQSTGLVKCSDCGEGFSFEAVRKIFYSTTEV